MFVYTKFTGNRRAIPPHYKAGASFATVSQCSIYRILVLWVFRWVYPRVCNTKYSHTHWGFAVSRNTFVFIVHMMACVYCCLYMYKKGRIGVHINQLRVCHHRTHTHIYPICRTYIDRYRCAAQTHSYVICVLRLYRI